MDIKKLWEKYYNALKEQDWTDALSAMDSIKKERPRDSQVYLKMGDLLQRMGNGTGAVESYHRSAVYLEKEGFVQKAAAIFKIILRLDPNNREAAIKLEKIFEAAVSAKSVFPPFSAPAADAQSVAPEAPSYPGPDSQVRNISRPEEIQQPVEPLKQPEMPEQKEPRPGCGEITLDDDEISGAEEKILKTIFKKSQKKEEKKAEAFEDFDDLLAETGKDVPIAEKRPKSKADLPVFLAPLSKDQALEFIRKSTTRTYRTGERIIREGDTGDSLFFIRKGSVKVIAHILGKEFVLATLSKGDVFGEVTFLTGRPRTASIVAEADNEVLEFDRQLIEEAISKNPEVLECLNDLYETRVSSTIKKVMGD